MSGLLQQEYADEGGGCWNCVVQEVKKDSFTALVRDRINAGAASELVEFDLSELSSSDRTLLCEGASFCWSIAYRDAPTGQRDLVSSFRFARQGRVSEEQMARIFDRADRVSALLEHD